MNRLVIIGNGFDLAHGLPTSYKHFIDDYWKKACDTKGIKKIEYQDDFVTLTCELGNMYNTFDYEAIDNIGSYSELKKFVERNKEIGYGYFVVEFKNSFFKKICENSIENWVDVENEYYEELKYIIRINEKSQNRIRATDDQNKERIAKLNIEFEKIKVLLEKYLIENVEEKYDFSKDVTEKFIDIFEANVYEERDLDMFFMEVSKKTVHIIENEFKIEKEEIENEFKRNEMLGGFVKKPFKKQISIINHFLSFNYTSNVFNYIKSLNMNLYNLNEIHGRLEDERNLINFGFGDEMDKHYQEIEEKNDNEYLKNIKSFQYLHTPNYKRLLDLIDSEKFQVYIMGHSCGLSDRTLLNTIFEHENCCSIKVFYHEKKDKNENVIKDNYTEITQNISRHFNKKKLMREKIVNKTLCRPLPQIQLPLK